MTTEIPIEDHPMIGHAALLATYSGGVVLAATFLGRRRRPLAMPGPVDLALLGLATFKLSRLLTRERVTRPLRAPFTEGEPAPAGDGEVEAPAGGQVRRAVGELLTCPFCASVWVGTAATLAFAAAPQPTRLAASALTSISIADASQYLLAGLRRLDR